MSKVSLERVKELAQQLSPEDRSALFYFLAGLPDSGMQSHTLEPPPITLDEAKETEAITADGDGYTVLSTGRAARLLLKGRTIFDVFYYPENFLQSRMEIRSWKDALPSESAKVELRSMLELVDSKSELTEEDIISLLKQAQAQVFEAVSYRVSQEVSARLPHMTALLFDAGIKIIELSLGNAVAEQTGRQKKGLDQIVEDLEPYWSHIKAHLVATPVSNEIAEVEVVSTGTVAEGSIPFTEDNIKHLFEVTTSENMVIGHLNGNEIFRLTFNPENFAENAPKHWPIPTSSESARANLRLVLKEHNPELSDEEINAQADRFGSIALKVMTDMKAKHIADRISENLDGLLIAVMEDAIKAYAIEGTIELNAQAGKKIDVCEYKDAILKTHWSRISEMAGIKRGGARERKGFVWTGDKKIAFYEKVEALPQYKEKSVWQFLLDELIEAEFNIEAITWLKNNPALKAIPEELITLAIKVWRKYLPDEAWDEMKPEDKPRAFEFRHALNLLGYPAENTYATLETYYYEGKKLSEKQK